MDASLPRDDVIMTITWHTHTYTHTWRAALEANDVIVPGSDVTRGYSAAGKSNAAGWCCYFSVRNYRTVSSVDVVGNSRLQSCWPCPPRGIPVAVTSSWRHRGRRWWSLLRLVQRWGWLNSDIHRLSQRTEYNASFSYMTTHQQSLTRSGQRRYDYYTFGIDSSCTILAYN